MSALVETPKVSDLPWTSWERVAISQGEWQSARIDLQGTLRAMEAFLTVT